MLSVIAHVRRYNRYFRDILSAVVALSSTDATRLEVAGVSSGARKMIATVGMLMPMMAGAYKKLRRYRLKASR